MHSSSSGPIEMTVSYALIIFFLILKNKTKVVRFCWNGIAFEYEMKISSEHDLISINCTSTRPELTKLPACKYHHNTARKLSSIRAIQVVWKHGLPVSVYTCIVLLSTYISFSSILPNTCYQWKTRKLTTNRCLWLDRVVERNVRILCV